jgi:transglutaminase-like putative cysteine protease
MARYAIRHETRYGYGAPVDLGLHLLRLTPLNLARQRLIEHALAITPEPVRVASFVDHFGNEVQHIVVETTHESFSVTLDAKVEVSPSGGPLADGEAWEAVRETMRADGFPASPTVAEFVYPSPMAALGREATDYAAVSFTPGRPIFAALRDLTTRIHNDFAYAPNQTDISTKVAEVLTARRGVCQDFAHLMIAGLRGLGLPARYVSGYIRSLGGRTGADASHAWVSAWCGGTLGWVELDPTNDLVVEDEHVVVAYGRDFSDATPLRGVILGGGRHTLGVAVSVTSV